MDISIELEKIVSKALQSDKYFLVDIQVGGDERKKKIQIVLDGDRGIGVDTCAEVSRLVSEQIEIDQLIKSAFVLEVTSPGIDTPLKLHRQYENNIGRDVRVQLKDNKTHEGKLTKVFEDSIVVQSGQEKGFQKNEVQLSFDQIKKTQVIVSFK